MGIERLRVVLDTNIYVAAYLAKNPNSPTVELLKRWRNGDFDVLYSVRKGSIFQGGIKRGK